MPKTIADLTRRVSRGYGLPVSQARALLGNPIFTIQLDDLRDEEASDVFVVRPSWGTIGQEAVVGEFSHVQIFNPLGSGVLCVVEEVLLDSSAADFARIGRSDTALATAGTQQNFRDRRIRGAPACLLRRDTNAVQQVTSDIGFSIPASTTIRTGLDAILEPGRGLGFELITANLTLTVSVVWREETV